MLKDLNARAAAIAAAITLSTILGTTAIAGGPHKHGKSHHHSLPSAVTDSDFYDGGIPNMELVSLGQALMFDKILSGNQNISCATCHHPFVGTSDGLSLPIGEGAKGLSVARDTGEGADAVPERVPRNAPAVFNLGAREFNIMFHDGRVFVDAEQTSGFVSPAGDNLPTGLANVLAAQAMFPVTSGTEMAGQEGENTIADAAAAENLAGLGGVWAQLADRLRAIPEYVDLFSAAFGISAEQITYVHAANAIAAFEAAAWRADDSPFDRFLRGNKHAMSKDQKDGMKLFYGKAGCGACHSGSFQTDQAFHAIAMPQIGAGKGDGVAGNEDFGRERVTGEESDRFKFRTPSLRNVTLTGPWGHDGAYNSLEAVVRHHLDPEQSLEDYDTTQAVLPSREDLDDGDFVAHENDDARDAIAAANELRTIRLSDKKVGKLMEFLHALTDRRSVDLRFTAPMTVPSGLPVAD
jgi:cytochrome c peroxidase